MDRYTIYSSKVSLQLEKEYYIDSIFYPRSEYRYIKIWKVEKSGNAIILF